MRTLRYLVYLAATVTAGAYLMWWLSGSAGVIGISPPVLGLVVILAAAPWLLERHFPHWLGTLALAVVTLGSAWWLLW